MLQFITHQNNQYSTIEGAKEALEGGCKWIQLRMKDSTIDEVKATALELKEICKKYEALLILDDHVELTAELEIDGVHLGKYDMPPADARKKIGEQYIIGGTANTFEDIQQLVAQDVDYIGLGPFRFTETKKKLSPVLGLEGYKKIMEECRKHDIKVPVVAIGGITTEDISDIMQTGVSGIALSGAILNSSSPKTETSKIINLLNKNRK
ncbi:thiamine phosphate synthase [Barnesiella propionica]|uniref:thiamine phosphate synthase n=1 Tax=Barnesiella propionica TaxID=2981781 RepID=UPI0011CA9754|nr:thiamine phosphate synthase [Barnesiella propionica]MCU6769920.1 thiamine phosphate synthase [Barnesiella propionica]